MLSTILLILKIIGIILAILVAVLFFVLVIPFKYVINGEFEEDKKGNALLLWLKFVIIAGVYYDNSDMRMKIKILGVPIINKQLGNKKEETSNNIGAQNSKKNEKKNLKNNKQKTANNDDNNEIEFAEFEHTNIEDVQETNMKSKLDSIIFKIKSKIGLVKVLKGKFNDAKRLIKSKGAKMALNSSKVTITKILKHLKPKKIKANLEFGFDTPDKTGQAIAVLSIIYGLIEIDTSSFNIQPNFQKKVINGYLFVKGKLMLGYVLVLAVQLYLKREIKFMIKQLKKLTTLTEV